jgi:hypothetical protein
MFEQIMRASEAAAAHRAVSNATPVLEPALWGCASCNMSAMIASPVWLNCSQCGAGLTLLQSASSKSASPQPH